MFMCAYLQVTGWADLKPQRLRVCDVWQHRIYKAYRSAERLVMDGLERERERSKELHKGCRLYILQLTVLTIPFPCCYCELGRDSGHRRDRGL